MATTSLQVTEAILASLVLRLNSTDTDTKDFDILVKDYERIIEMIREGYQFSDEQLQDLPQTLRTEVTQMFEALNLTSGNDGKSAYQIWLDLDNIGSQEDFINSFLPKIDSNTDIDWISLTPHLINEWVQYDALAYSCKIKRIGNLVSLKGLVKNGLSSSVLNLPVKYRPSSRIYCQLSAFHTSPSSGNIGDAININSDGLFRVSNAHNSPSWVSIHCVYFVD